MTDLGKTVICSRCLIQKPFSAFHKSKSSHTGFHRWCKVCRRLHDSGHLPIQVDRRLKPQHPEPDQCCRTCKEWKPSDAFEPRSGREKGRKSQCIECYRQRELFKQNHPVRPKIIYPQGYGEGSRLLRIYGHMKERCFCPKEQSYMNYGARGITVCQEWRDDYLTFLKWALSHGYAAHLTIERMNNDGPYSPENCRWATRKEQNRNTRKNRFITAWGETKLLCEWVEDPRCFVTRQSLRLRLNKGESPEDALTRTNGLIRRDRLKITLL